MTTTFIGTTFAPASDWYIDEKKLIANIHNQIDQKFPDSRNLFINTTWFGPQFDNNEWNQYKQTISQQQFDCVFMLAAADPVFLNNNQLLSIQQETNSRLYLLGHFETEYYFNFHSQVLPRYFVDYSECQLPMRTAKYTYVNYNRKPRDHRSALVNQLIEKDLLKHGIVTLGKQDNIFSKEFIPVKHLSLNETVDDAVGNWGMAMDFGIPHDIHSLGNMNIWQNHFLNVVGETEFLPWDNMFISEKTWKPVLGMRPFVINGQQKIYKYLVTNGFKTFNHYWPHIDIEHGDVHSTIIELIVYLNSLGQQKLENLYQDMLLDLEHNRNRFFEYAKEQQYKINHLFQ